MSPRFHYTKRRTSNTVHIILVEKFIKVYQVLFLTYQAVTFSENAKIFFVKSCITTEKSCLSKFETFYGMERLWRLLLDCLVILPMNCIILL